MYNDFFQLRLNPFSQKHPLNSVFLPSSHRLVLEQLTEEVNKSSGIFLLLGPIGVGKSSLTNALIEKHKVKNTKTVFKHLNPSSSLQLSASEPDHMAMIIKKFSDTYSINTDSKIKNVFILDNANHFSTHFLNSLLTKVSEQNKNNKPTLLILTGQPKLQLQIKSLTVDIHLLPSFIKTFLLSPFEQTEITDYINNRLLCAEYSRNTLFDDQAIHYIAKLSKGIPWAINTICSVSLFQADLDKQSIITKETVKTATEFCYLEQCSVENQPTNNIINPPVKKELIKRPLTTSYKAKIKTLKESNIPIKQQTKNLINSAV